MFQTIWISKDTFQKLTVGNSLAQWLGLSAFTAVGSGSIPRWGTKILQAARCGWKQQQPQNKLTVDPKKHRVLTTGSPGKSRVPFFELDKNFCLQIVWNASSNFAHFLQMCVYIYVCV